LILIFLLFFYKQGFSYFINYTKEYNDSSINVKDLIFPVVFCVSLLMFFYKIDSAFLFFLEALKKQELGVFALQDLHKKIVPPTAK
ncbi:MAG: hypothetical protein WCG06_04410, partial [Candidatus Omnitrophota bacterium]